MLGFYNYTVILTYIGMAFGAVGIITAFEGNSFLAVIFLMLSAVCDMFDGKIAKLRKRTDREKRFGIQIDSLSDFLCFGVLPAAIGYSVGMNQWYFYPVLVAYILAALIRLAYFNVMEEERQQQTTEDRDICIGLPVTPAAIIFPFTFLATLYFSEVFAYIYAAVMIVVGICFIANFKIKKLKMKGLLVMIAFGSIIAAVLLVFGQ